MKFVPPTAFLLVVAISILMVSQGYGHHASISEVLGRATGQETSDNELQESLGEENEDGGKERNERVAALVQVRYNNDRNQINNYNQNNNNQNNPRRQRRNRSQSQQPNQNRRIPINRLPPRLMRRNWVPGFSTLNCRSNNPLAEYTDGTVPRRIRHLVRDFLDQLWYDNNVPRPLRNCGRGLTILDIIKMANSMLGDVFRASNQRRSYAYLPRQGNNCAARLYESRGRNGQPCTDNHHPKRTCKRNWKDSEMFLIEDCDRATEYWSVWTPCYYCQASLMQWKRQHQQVTIHLGKRYYGPVGDRQKATTTDCLAHMMRQGFNFEAWVWTDFMAQAHIDAGSDCEDLVELLQYCREFVNRRNDVRAMIRDARRIRDDQTITDAQLGTRCPDLRYTQRNRRP